MQAIEFINLRLSMGHEMFESFGFRIEIFAEALRHGLNFSHELLHVVLQAVLLLEAFDAFVWCELRFA